MHSSIHLLKCVRTNFRHRFRNMLSDASGLKPTPAQENRICILIIGCQNHLCGSVYAQCRKENPHNVWSHHKGQNLPRWVTMLLPAFVVHILSEVEDGAVQHLPKWRYTDHGNNFCWKKGVICHTNCPQHARHEGWETITNVDEPTETFRISVTLVKKGVEHPNLTPTFKR